MDQWTVLGRWWTIAIVQHIIFTRPPFLRLSTNQSTNNGLFLPVSNESVVWVSDSCLFYTCSSIFHVHPHSFFLFVILFYAAGITTDRTVLSTMGHCFPVATYTATTIIICLLLMRVMIKLLSLHSWASLMIIQRKV